jgi:chitin disaccharide deacetylase
MANGRAFDNAVALAKTVPHLGVGCHIVLIDGEPVLEAERLPSIVPLNAGVPRNSGSGFSDNLKSFALRSLTGLLHAQEIELEAEAQIRKLQSAGIRVSHVDTHKHTHLFPSVLKPILRAARACGVEAIRNPFGPRRPLRSGELLARPSLWTRYAEVKIFRALANKFRDAVKRAGFLTTDGTFGIEVTGSLDEKLFLAIAEIIPDGTWEFVCHPGYNDSDLRAANTRLRESRETELRVLTMPEAREMLAGRGIELISYRDLVTGAKRP